MSDLVAELRQEAESWKAVAESYENDRLEQKAEIGKLRAVLEMGIQLCEIGGHGSGDKCPTCHFMREAKKALGHQQASPPTEKT